VPQAGVAHLREMQVKRAELREILEMLQAGVGDFGMRYVEVLQLSQASEMGESGVGHFCAAQVQRS